MIDPSWCGTVLSVAISVVTKCVLRSFEKIIKLDDQRSKERVNDLSGFGAIEICAGDDLPSLPITV
jgi:hypothetical protein